MAQLVASLGRNLAQAETRFAARHGIVFQGRDRVATAKSGTFARKIAFALNQSQQTRAFLKAIEAVVINSGTDASAVAAIGRALGEEDQ